MLHSVSIQLKLLKLTLFWKRSENSRNPHEKCLPIFGWFYRDFCIKLALLLLMNVIQLKSSIKSADKSQFNAFSQDARKSSIPNKIWLACTANGKWSYFVSIKTESGACLTKKSLLILSQFYVCTFWVVSMHGMACLCQPGSDAEWCSEVCCFAFSQ